MPQRKASRAPLVLSIFALLGVAVALWVGLSVGPAPEISIRTGFDPPEGELALLGAANHLTIAVREPSRGIGGVRVEFSQDGSVRSLGEVGGPFRSAWAPWAAVPRPEATLALAVSREEVTDLREGAATVRVTAARSGGFLRRPAPVIRERSFAVRLRPPSLSVRSSAHYVAQGGSEVVVYEAGETAHRSGVRAGDWFFPGHPLPGGGGAERFALFAVPYDVDDPSAVRLVAEDEVGNRAERRFVDRFFARPLGTDTIRLDDEFLERAVPDILSQTPELRAGGSLLERYLAINGELRQRNAAELRDLAARSAPEFLWRGPFLPPRNAQATAVFAERRTYVYDGREVDTQDHMGFDLASTARAPVQAANDGTVVKAGWLGIYGNVVILDHGYGLMSLYGHLSSFDVQEGDAVSRGQEIGRTGITGLAGGDHLHFAILLQGLPVNPREWWDDHWLHDRLRLKLGPALPA